jgi:tight adherence protein C
MDMIITVILGISLLGIGAILLLLAFASINRDEVSPRLKTYVTEPVNQKRSWSPALAARTRELSGSMLNRILLPIFKKLGQFFGRLTPKGSLENIQHQLIVAGNPMNLKPLEFFGIRLVFTVLGLWLAWMVWRRESTQLNFMLSIAIFVGLLILPTLWLRMMVRGRQSTIQKGLPDALDMLSVCASAGLGFDQSMQRVSEYWDTPIAIELGRVVTEMEMGISRQEALRGLANRLDVGELTTFVSLVLQSDQLGMSISDTLLAQAEQMRIERRFRAQEQAQKIPIKMLFPLAFMIFPAIIAVVLGPAIPPIIDLFTGL